VLASKGQYAVIHGVYSLRRQICRSSPLQPGRRRRPVDMARPTWRGRRGAW